MCIAAALNQVGAVHGQAPNQAALIIRYGDGTIWTGCVTFAEPEITGLELLQRSGLEIVYARGGTGDLLCKIGPEGCDNPNQCLCQCSSAQCEYWSYWHLQDGQWQYSVVGASTYRIKPGAVDGWVWGIGTIAGAPQPPTVRFEEICHLVAPTATSTRADTSTLVASSTPSPSVIPTTSYATRHTASPTAPRTPLSTPTSQPTQTAAPTRSQAVATLTLMPAPDQQSSPTSAVTVAATPPGNPGSAAYLAFAVIVVILSFIGILVWRRGQVRP